MFARIILSPLMKFSTIQNTLKLLHQTHCLDANKPMFTINSGQVEILEKPMDFYVNLHKGIKSSQRRILWNSLYLGNGNLEKFLIESLTTHIHKIDSIRLSILLDYFRGMRRDQKTGESSSSLLEYVRTANILNHNIQIGFMRHPLLPKIFDIFEQAAGREIFNVHHMKWYVFDNKVIITGANLSQDYFLNRQDRYIVLHEVEEIADLLDDAQATMMQHSFQMDEEGKMKFNKEFNRSGKKFFKEFNQSWKMFQFAHQYKNEECFEQEEEIIKQKDVFNDQNSEIISNSFFRDLEISKKIEERIDQARFMYKINQFKQSLQQSFNEGDVQNNLRKIQKSLYTQEDKRDLDSGEDVHLFITFHLPYLQMTEDKELMQALMKSLSEIPNLNLCIASGYMNFTSQFVDGLKAINQNIKLITASPQANGFYKAGLVKSYIPYFYRSYQLDLMRKDKDNLFQMYQFIRKGWTFHAKGFWAYTDEDALITIVGSSNYSLRSFVRDNEIQMYIISKCPQLNKEFQMEQQKLLDQCGQKGLEDLKIDKEIQISLFTKVLGRLFKGFL